MNISRIDLNLLVYLDALLKERNVTRAANQVGISQPAMSNSLRRLRDLFQDPLLVRTSKGMSPTERALALQPVIRSVLADIKKAVEPTSTFEPKKAQRIFRITVSDYTESTLIPALLARLREEAPGIILDILTPSDVNFQDVEQGKVDMIINRFDTLPQSFYQMTVWQDSFSCLFSTDNPILEDFSLDNYLKSQHVWVSKIGMGVATGMNPNDAQRLGWVDEALARLGKQRNITVFTRHYQAAVRLAEQKDLIVTVPSRLAALQARNTHVAIRPPPFDIPPFDLKMAWSPLLQHNPAHQWLRRLVIDCARQQEQA